MLKSMRRVAGKFVEVLTGRTFLMMAGWALVSSAVSYASTSTSGLPWETPLQTVKQSLTGPVAAAFQWSASLPVAWLWSSAANCRSSPNALATQ